MYCVPSVVGVVPSYTVAYNTACIVQCGHSEADNGGSSNNPPTPHQVIWSMWASHSIVLSASTPPHPPPPHLPKPLALSQKQAPWQCLLPSAGPGSTAAVRMQSAAISPASSRQPPGHRLCWVQPSLHPLTLGDWCRICGHAPILVTTNSPAVVHVASEACGVAVPI